MVMPIYAPLNIVQEVDQRQAAILLTEEVLLEALCFDFVIESPHADLVELFETCESDSEVQEYAWSLAHDSLSPPFIPLSSVVNFLVVIGLRCVYYSPQTLLQLPATCLLNESPTVLTRSHSTRVFQPLPHLRIYPLHHLTNRHRLMRVVWPSKGTPLAKVSFLVSQVYNLLCFTFLL